MSRNPIVDTLSQALRQHPDFQALFSPQCILGYVLEARRDPVEGRVWIKADYDVPEGGKISSFNDIPLAWPPGIVPRMPRAGDSVILVVPGNATDPLYALAVIEARTAGEREAAGEYMPRAVEGFMG